jgi:hypothetical protein
VNRELAWMMAFGSVLGIAHHPRARLEAKQGDLPLMTTDEAAAIADAALKEYEKRFPGSG